MTLYRLVFALAARTDKNRLLEVQCSGFRLNRVASHPITPRQTTRTGESVPVLPFPHWSGIGWNGSCITSDVIRLTNASLLALARVPNIAGREPIEAFTPSYLRVRLAVDIHIEVVAEWESETFR